MLALANAGVDVLRLDAVPFMWKRLGTDCQNQPEVHDLLAAFRAAVRIAAPAVIFKAEAIVSPDDLVNYLGAAVPARVRAGVPQPADGAAVEQPGEPAHGADDPDAARDADHARGQGLDHLPAVPRRHRLGDHRGQRGRGGGGRARTPQVPRALLQRRLLGVVRARRGVPARVQRRRPHQRDGRVAGRARRRARGRRPGGDRPRDPPRPAPVQRRALLRRPAAGLHGRRDRPAQRHRLRRRSADGGRQPLAAPPADGLGCSRAPARPGLAWRGGCSAACGRSSPPAASARCSTPPAPSSRSTPGTRTSSATGASSTGAASPRWPASPRSSRRCAAMPAMPAAPAGRPPRRAGDYLVLPPYGYAWID